MNKSSENNTQVSDDDENSVNDKSNRETNDNFTQLEVCSDVLAQATDKEAQQQETTTKTFATTVSPTASATISVLLSQPFIYQPSSENRMVMFPTGLFHGTAKEGLKRTTSWSAYYYTSRGSWYPVPERLLGLFEIPPISLPPVVKASQDEISMMQEWERAHGSSVRQRSVRQETTMARAGTLPLRLFIPRGHPAAISESDSGSSISVTEEEAEYDLSSDEEICAGECFVEEESGLGNQQVSPTVCWRRWEEETQDQCLQDQCLSATSNLLTTLGPIPPDRCTSNGMAFAMTELDRTQEVLLCENVLKEESNQQNIRLPVFLNLPFEEMCHQAIADRRIIILGNNLPHVTRVLTALVNEDQNNLIYFWIARSDTRSGRKVKTKLGMSIGSEVFVLAPTTSQPILVEQYCGDTLKMTRYEDIMDAVQQGESAVASFTREW
ncbi:hypothetical protein OS493_001863 [Desmophyllum pertusum]|uniref:Uncharacterized protein n=1 Tax=Desmophyllum pertusum TaxID=174260 RepID=A0A9W9Z536_9CNID|nr:hypothetical protein OS493_001863 [Desmophyllum pertusum]